MTLIIAESTSLKRCLLPLFCCATAVRVIWVLHEPTVPFAVDCLEKQDLRLRLTVDASSTNAMAAPAMVQKLSVRVVAQPSGLCTSLDGARLRLSLYGSQPIAGGADLDATVRLSKPWGMRNPGGFDFERWLRANEYAATGYVREVHAVTSAPDPPTRYVNAALMRALTHGDSSGIRPAEWALFRNTGTIHLMVVSGLHVSILAGTAYLLANSTLRLLPCLTRALPLRFMAGGVALVCVWAYVATIGFAAPVTRAATMATAIVLCAMTRRAVTRWRIFFATLALLAFSEPLRVLEQGFWLSFGAVACIMVFFAPRARRSSAIRALLVCQLTLAIGLAPLLAVFVDEVPIATVPANLVAVPFMTMFIIPVVFVGTALSTLGFHSASQLADVGLAVLRELLAFVSGWQLGSIGPRQLSQVAPSIVAFTLAAAPTHRTLRVCAFAGALVWMVTPVMRVPLGHFAVTTFDVGQGTAVLIDMTSHRLLIDAGPRYRSGFDTGSAVVIPSIRSTGPDRLDLFVLSHADIDHAGGTQAVQRGPTRHRSALPVNVRAQRGVGRASRSRRLAMPPGAIETPARASSWCAAWTRAR